MRPTMVIAPTLDLVGQWYDRLKIAFQQEVGILGGGCMSSTSQSVHTILPIHLGKYGLGLPPDIDEVHHLPAPACRSRNYWLLFGLATATLEREDGREKLLDTAIGPVVYRKETTELSGSFLASYETINIIGESKEKQEYEEAKRNILIFYVETDCNEWVEDGINLYIAARSAQGRSAFQAYLKSKQLAQSAQGKIECLERLIHRHKGAKTIILPMTIVLHIRFRSYSYLALRIKRMSKRESSSAFAG